MTRLLVSVRNADEAAAALAGGADIIDAKEPCNGPMGRCENRTIEAIVAAVGQRAPVSAACGELGDDTSLLPSGVTFVKTALRGWRDRTDLTKRWSAHREQLPRDCSPIIVAYADGALPEVASPPVAPVLELAISSHCAGLLIDTAEKHHGRLCDWLDHGQLREIVARCRDANILIAFAGSLDLQMIESLLPTRPDIVAVRGAACDGGRTGRISKEKVRKLTGLVHAAKPSCPN